MKASELMQGDLLFSLIDRNGLIEKKAVRVTGIRTDCDFPCIQTDESDVWYSVETYEPVPITPEILEKNGMRVFEHRNPWQGENLIKKWYSKDGRSYISYYRVGGIFTYTVGDNVSRICGLKYVHQLQHALRLCGIEKEITI